MCVYVCVCMDVTADVWLTQCFLCFKCCMGRWISLKSVTDAGLNGHHINAMYLSRVKHWGKFIGRICFSFYRAQEQRKVYEHSIQIITSCVMAVLSTLMVVTPIARFMGPTWDPPRPIGPRWAPCWPREPCYQGRLSPTYFI